MECKLDYMHSALWCQACHAIEQEARKASALEALGDKVDALAEALIGFEGAPAVIAPPRPAPRPPPPPPAPPPPNPGIGYKWRT
jgi:hypothetical protein